MFKLLSVLILFGSLGVSAAESWDDVCDVERLPHPVSPLVDPQIGALGTLPNGDIIAAFHRGEVMVLSKGVWKMWASGLHEPLGMHVEDQHTIVVVQRAELTKISDTDRDGTADSYMSLCSGWGMSGNYHEFAFGATKAGDGDFYVSLGTASSGSGVRPELRGEWNAAGGVTHEKSRTDYIRATKKKNLQRMYARVPHRGWVIKVNPKTGEYKPIASGLRTPHGVCVTSKGDLYVNDNEGDWLGSSKLYKIEEGKFYGHAASLIWTKGWDRGVPANLKPSELDAMRTKSVCFLPQGDLANSPTQIIELPKKGFGCYGGDLIMGDMNQSRLVRYLPDEVNGVEQGAVLGFMEHSKLGRGNAKITVGDGGVLYIGKTHLSWAGDAGLLALKYKDVPHLAIREVKLTEVGFQVVLNEAVDASGVSIEGIHYGLHYHKKYGSKKVNPTACKARSIKSRGKVLDIVLEERPVAGRVYDISLVGVRHGELGSLFAGRFFYTAHQVVGNGAGDKKAGVADIAPDLYVFENAFRGRDLSVKKQINILRDAGCDGIGSISEKGDLLSKLRAYRESGVKVYSVYAGGSVTDDSYTYRKKELGEAMKFLRGSGAMVEFYIKGDKGSELAQEQAVKMMKEVADLAGGCGLKVVIYVHSGQFFLASTFDQSVKIARLVGRENVGVMFNLCHCLKDDSGLVFETAFEGAKDLLLAVSTSGAEEGGKSWSQLIQPLREDSFRQLQLFKALRKIGYKGAVGLQCYKIPQGPGEYLAGASQAYQGILKLVR